MKYEILEQVGIGSRAGRIGKIRLEDGKVRVVYNDDGFINIGNERSYIMLKGKEFYINR